MPATVSIIVSQSSSGNTIADVKKDLSDLGSHAKDAGGGFSSLGEIATGALRHIGEIALDAAIGGVKAIGGAVTDTISAARESNQIFAQTEQVIKSTGGAAGLTAQQVADYSSSLSAAAGKSLFGDEQISQSANLLLTFTNIKGKALEAATAMSVDMAQAMGGAPKDAAIQLGKALNDPVKGITALTRVGVTFDDEQKKLIKTYVEHGQMAKAQGVILAELNKEFGGSAAAAAKADGGWAQFHDRMGEVQETIGKALLPILGQFAGFLNDTIAPAVEKAAAAFSAWLADPATQAGIQAITEAIGVGLNAAFSFLSGTLNNIIGIWHDAGEAASSLGEQIGIFVDVVLGGWNTQSSFFQDSLMAIEGVLSGLAATFSDAKNPVEGFLNVLSEISPMFAFLRGVVEAALPPIQAIVESVFTIISNLVRDHGAEMLASAQAVWNQVHILIETVLPPIQAIIQTVFGAIATFLHSHGTEIETFLATTWSQISGIIQMAIAIITAVVVPAFQTIATFLRQHSADIQNILSGAWQTISSIISGVLGLISGLLHATLQAMQGDWSGAWGTIQSTAAGFVTSIGTAISGFLGMIAGLFGTTLPQIAAVWESNWNALQTLVGTVTDAIGTTVSGWFSTLSGYVTAGMSAISTAWDTAWNGLQTLVGTVTGGISGTVSGWGATLSGYIDPIVATVNGIGTAWNGLVSTISGAISSIIGFIQDLIDKINSIPSMPIPGFASGTDFAPGGLAVVGEHGPETIYLPRGSQVTPGVSGSYNRNVTMNVTNNLSGAEIMDYSLAATLAGV